MTKFIVNNKTDVYLLFTIAVSNFPLSLFGTSLKL